MYPNGSTGKIVNAIHNKLLKLNHNSIICFGRGENRKQKGIYKTSTEIEAKFNNLISRFTGVMYAGCYFSTKKLKKIIIKEKPDIVHLHCLNGYFVNVYNIIEFLNKQKIPTVLTLHAEFMYTGNCNHAYNCDKWQTGCGKCNNLKYQTNSIFIDNTHYSWEKMKKAFEDFNNLYVVSVSPWVMNRATLSPILKGKRHTVILNGVDTNIFTGNKQENVLQKYNLNDYNIILHVTPEFSISNNDNKGGKFIIMLAEKLKNYPNYRIVVIGKYNKKETYPENIVFIGYTKNVKELSDWYASAKYTVITSKRETFSMVLAESLCSGTPVLCFKSGGPETIGIENMSKFFEYGDINGIYKQIISIPNLSCNSEEAQSKYSLNNMCNEYIKLYTYLLNNKKNCYK